MNKFNNSLVKGYEEKKEKEEQNQKLKEKYNIDKNVVVVEKSNTFKFTVNFAVNFFKTICTVLILLLGCIGLYSLIIPDIREVLIKDWFNVLEQLEVFLGG